MPQLTDRASIRRILEADRLWAVYALADLEPGFFKHTRWFSSAGEGPGVALIYSGFGVPVLITIGKVEEFRAILDEVEATLNPPQLYIVVQPEIIPLLRERYELSQEKAMQRMVLDPTRYQSGVMDGVVELGPAHLEAVRRLYADGETSGEAPDWFMPEMLVHGVYYGVREAGELVAVAGTHVVSVSEGVGCIGNIYTRRDRRGRGFGTQVTAAVTARLLSVKLETIALNVGADNVSAIRVYERLGFRRHCGFVEAVAIKV